MNIAILGGSFDPPHLGHYLVASQIKKYTNIDQVWLMPCYSHPFDKKLSSPAHRLTMTKYLENDFIKVSDHEVRKPSTSYSVDTLHELTQNYPQHLFAWIMGSDQIGTFTKWRHWREIIQQFNLIIFPRGTIDPEVQNKAKNAWKMPQLPGTLTFLASPQLVITNLSSTLIRDRVKKHLPITQLVSEKVEAYISQNYLYTI